VNYLEGNLAIINVHRWLKADPARNLRNSQTALILNHRQKGENKQKQIETALRQLPTFLPWFSSVDGMRFGTPR
jgi:hypothetical protein